MGTRILHLVRHGDYLPGETSDKLGRGLSAAGRRQAKHTADRLSEVALAAVYCSTAPRAVETARIIAERHGGLSPRKTGALFECVPSVPPSMHTLFEPILDDYPPDHVANCRKQLDEAFKRFFRPTRGQDRHEVLVCHGNVIRSLVTRTLDVHEDAWVRMTIALASVSRVSVGRGPLSPSLEALNDVSHLPPELRAISI